MIWFVCKLRLFMSEYHPGFTSPWALFTRRPRIFVADGHYLGCPHHQQTRFYKSSGAQIHPRSFTSGILWALGLLTFIRCRACRDVLSHLDVRWKFGGGAGGESEGSFFRTWIIRWQSYINCLRWCTSFRSAVGFLGMKNWCDAVADPKLWRETLMMPALGWPVTWNPHTEGRGEAALSFSNLPRRVVDFLQCEMSTFCGGFQFMYPQSSILVGFSRTKTIHLGVAPFQETPHLSWVVDGFRCVSILAGYDMFKGSSSTSHSVAGENPQCLWVNICMDHTKQLDLTGIIRTKPTCSPAEKLDKPRNSILHKSQHRPTWRKGSTPIAGWFIMERFF